MKILLTNDDGFDAPGLIALAASVLQHASLWMDDPSTLEIVVVAPDRGRSECSHSVTTGRDLLLAQVDAPVARLRNALNDPVDIGAESLTWFAVDGTPADCVRVALHTIAEDAAVVISGINAGANVGIDCIVSGTVAAAREAALLGRPAMAISHYRRPELPKTWGHVGDWLRDILVGLCESAVRQFDRADSNGSFGSAHSVELGDFSPGTFWNVNLPALQAGAPIPEVVRCPMDTQGVNRTAELLPAGDAVDSLSTAARDSMQAAHRVEMRSGFHDRPRTPGSDIDICFGGRISVTQC